MIEVQKWPSCVFYLPASAADLFPVGKFQRPC